MVGALLALVAWLRSAWLFELVGAALIVGGIWSQWGEAPAAIAGGTAVLLKSYELDQRGDR